MQISDTYAKQYYDDIYEMAQTVSRRIGKDGGSEGDGAEDEHNYVQVKEEQESMPVR